MNIHFRDVVVLIVVSWLSLTSAHNFDSSQYPAQDVITRDFCIIGGGSSGTYAAIRLHDMGKSVAVVERNDRLGGHTETYIDPATQTPIDIGVVNWNNLDVVKNYFARLNVSYFVANNTFVSSSSPTEYVDLSTGKQLSTYSPPDPTAAFGAYAAQLARFPYLSSGFDLPSPVPEDLLLPFGQFVTRYALEDSMFLINSYAEGIGDLLGQPTLYVMKLIGLDLINTLQTGFIATTSNDNSEVYEKALNILSADVLLRSHVVATDRGCNDGYVKVLVKTSNSGTKLIQAKKIIITIPPRLNNLVGFDLSVQEATLFAQFGTAAYYTGLLLNSGIGSTSTVINVGENTTYNLPVLPGPYGFYPSTVPTLTHVFYDSSYQLPAEHVKADIISTLLRLQQQQQGDGNVTTSSTTTPSFATFSSHVPFEMTVPTSAIAGGFYRELYGLQGQRGTYYTGAAFHTQDSALLWRFTEGLLPTIVGYDEEFNEDITRLQQLNPMPKGRKKPKGGKKSSGEYCDRTCLLS